VNTGPSADTRLIGYTAAKAKLPIKIETLKRSLVANVPQITIEINLKAFDPGLNVGSKSDD
jgi:Pyruvate/2-oxoacid:ferredoxin oxidoreductase gamma subunit